MTIPLDVEGSGLVLPGDLVEVQKLRELAFAVVREVDSLMGKGGRSPRFLGRAPLGQLPLLDSRSVCF
jgi:hypothetical protein